MASFGPWTTLAFGMRGLCPTSLAGEENTRLAVWQSPRGPLQPLLGPPDMDSAVLPAHLASPPWFLRALRLEIQTAQEYFEQLREP